VVKVTGNENVKEVFLFFVKSGSDLRQTNTKMISGRLAVHSQ